MVPTGPCVPRHLWPFATGAVAKAPPTLSPPCKPIQNPQPCGAVFLPVAATAHKTLPSTRPCYWSDLHLGPAQTTGCIHHPPHTIHHNPRQLLVRYLDEPSVKTTYQLPFCFRIKTSSKISLSSASHCFLITRCCCFEGGALTSRGTLCSICTPGWNQHSNTDAKCHESRRDTDILGCCCHDLQTDNHLAIKASFEYTSP